MRKTINSLIIVSIIFFSHSLIAKGWDHLFNFSKYQNAKISPKGDYIAVAMDHDGKTVLAVLKTTDRSMTGSLNFSNGYEVGDYYWANNERLVIKMVRKVGNREQPQYFGELYAVNFDGSRGKLIYGYQAGVMQTGSRMKKKKSIRGWANIIDTLPEDEKHILISSTPMSNTGEKLSSALLLNVYTGIIKKNHGRSPIPFSEFLTDNNGNLKAVIGTNAQDINQLYIQKESKWQQVPKGTVGESVSIISIDPTGEYLYTFDNIEQDRFGIFKLNLKTNVYKNLYTDKKVDISHVKLSNNGRTIYALAIDDGYPAYLLLNNKMEEARVFKNFLKTFPYSSIDITSRTDNDELYVVKVSSDTDPGSLYLFDKVKNTLELLFKFKPNINNKELLQTAPIEYTASDGVKIHGYFTQAKAKQNNTPAPVVVLVHGGPHGVRDHWQFDSEVQYLALNGYSVLQINYRGSGGYGENFESIGHKMWGTLIQQDIFEGYQWLVKENKAQDNNVCIMGASFGAYSAIQSATLYSNTYKCAVANAGIYDLELMFEEGDTHKVKSGMSYLKKVLGTDKSLLKSMSPVNYVEKIQIPLFLAHGKDDERAPFEHAERLKTALDKAQKPYQWFVLDKEEHGFYNPENRKTYMRNVLQFLDKNLKK